MNSKYLSIKSHLSIVGLIRPGMALAFLFCLSIGCGSPQSYQNRLDFQFAGTYSTTGALTEAKPGFPPFLSEGMEIQSLLMLHSDGTALTRWNFGPPAAAINPAFGVWERIGRNEIKVVFLFYGVPRLADPLGSEPELSVNIGRVTTILKWNPETRMLEGTFANEVFFGPVDPLDPSSVPGAVFIGKMLGAQKLEILDEYGAVLNAE